MALTTILRNVCKINGARTLQQASLKPVKTYTTANTSQLTARKLTHADLAMPMSQRRISLTSPKLSAAGTNHATIWNIDRAIILGMLGIIPAAFISPSQTMDTFLATAIIIHQHWGLEAMVVDYIRPSIVGPVLPKIAHVALYLLSVAAFSGLLYLIYNDIGIAQSIKKLWAVKGGPKDQ